MQKLMLKMKLLLSWRLKMSLGVDRTDTESIQADDSK